MLSRELVHWRSCCASLLLCQSFTQGFLGPLFTSLPLLGFVGQHSHCASPFHYFIPRASSTRYFLFTSFTPMGCLLDPLGFLDPITISLPLFTSWAYWPLSRSIEFTNSFLHFPGFLGSFTPSLPFFIPWAYYLILWASSARLHLYLFFIVVGLLAINSTISAC